MSVIEEGKKKTEWEGQHKCQVTQKQGEQIQQKQKSCINYRTEGGYKYIKKRTQTIEWSTSACFFCWPKNRWWHDYQENHRKLFALESVQCSSRLEHFPTIKTDETVSVCAVEQTPKLQRCTLQETPWIQARSWTGHCETKNYVSVIYKIDLPRVHKYFAFPLSYELLNT